MTRGLLEVVLLTMVLAVEGFDDGLLRTLTLIWRNIRRWPVDILHQFSDELVGFYGSILCQVQVVSARMKFDGLKAFIHSQMERLPHSRLNFETLPNSLEQSAEQQTRIQGRL